MSFFRPRTWFRHRPSRDFAWIVPDQFVLAAYPSDEELRRYRDLGVRVIVNLHHRAHDPDLIASLGLTEVHLPVRDFTPPTPGQLDQGVAAIRSGVDSGKAVLVHCQAGLGRSGTLAACYLVSQGMKADQAIARVRELRPGAIETSRQEKAVEVWSQLPGRAK